MILFKKLFLATLLLFFLPKVYAQNDSIQIKGILKGLGNNAVWISFSDNAGVSRSYKANAINDNFILKVPKLNSPSVARFDVSLKRGMEGTVNGSHFANPAPALDMFIYNQDISIEGEAQLVQFASVKGDEENNTFNDYKKSVMADTKLGYEIRQAMFEPSSNKSLYKDSKSLQEEGIAAVKRTIVKQKEFIKENPDAFASLFLLSRMQTSYTSDNFINAWNGLSNRYKNDRLAIGIKNYIKKISGTVAGNQAIDFERKDTKGNLVNLSDFKGRTILLDFWGSWCGPCRASNPHLKEIHDKYKSKGFEIISIAQERGKTIEDSKNSWLKAIEDDGMDWVNVLNQEGIEKLDVVKAYSILGFPTKILVNGEGKIILRVTASITDDIDKELEKIYGF